jgi:hypothetical protein
MAMDLVQLVRQATRLRDSMQSRKQDATHDTNGVHTKEMPAPQSRVLDLCNGTRNKQNQPFVVRLPAGYTCT